MRMHAPPRIMPRKHRIEVDHPPPLRPLPPRQPMRPPIPMTIPHILRIPPRGIRLPDIHTRALQRCTRRDVDYLQREALVYAGLARADVLTQGFVVGEEGAESYLWGEDAGGGGDGGPFFVAEEGFVVGGVVAFAGGGFVVGEGVPFVEGGAVWRGVRKGVLSMYGCMDVCDGVGVVKTYRGELR